MKLVKRKFLFSVLMAFCCYSIIGQTFQGKYDKAMENNKAFSFKHIKELSTSNNAYNFMAIGYFINANNNMFVKTKDIKYLKRNIEVVRPIFLEEGTSNYLNDNWRMAVSNSNQNSIANGKEHMISEGYFFKYVGEFLDILCTNNMYQQYQNDILKGLKYSFTKWQERSFLTYKDFSLFFHQRIHTGANWALVGLYLNKYDSKNSSTYKSFIDLFDDQLKKSLVLKTKGDLVFYEWNSTYPEKFCNSLKKMKNYNPVVQDVTHGNHVVLYLIKAYELNNVTWDNFDFTNLANTLKVNIIKDTLIMDNVDGTSNEEQVLQNSGWKISDGWYKLIYFDEDLVPYFNRVLPTYQNKIKDSFIELQFNSIYL